MVGHSRIRIFNYYKMIIKTTNFTEVIFPLFTTNENNKIWVEALDGANMVLPKKMNLRENILKDLKL